MKISIRNLKTMQGLEGLAVRCNVYVDGQSLGIYHDDGNGGEPVFQLLPNSDATRSLYKKLEDYIALKIGLPIGTEIDRSQKMKYEFDDLVSEAIDAKEKEQRFKRQMKKNIIYGKNINDCILSFWKKYTLEHLSMNPKTFKAVQDEIDRIKASLKEGETILNKEYLKSLGWKV